MGVVKNKIIFEIVIDGIWKDGKMEDTKMFV